MKNTSKVTVQATITQQFNEPKKEKPKEKK